MMTGKMLIIHGGGIAFFARQHRDGQYHLWCISCGKYYDYGYYPTLQETKEAAYQYCQD